MPSIRKQWERRDKRGTVSSKISGPWYKPTRGVLHRTRSLLTNGSRARDPRFRTGRECPGNRRSWKSRAEVGYNLQHCCVSAIHRPSNRGSAHCTCSGRTSPPCRYAGARQGNETTQSGWPLCWNFSPRNWYVVELLVLVGLCTLAATFFETKGVGTLKLGLDHVYLSQQCWSDK